MSKANDMADSIRRFARQYKDMTDAAELLDQYGSLENAIAEAKNSLGKSQQLRDKGIADLNKVMLDIDEANKKQAATLDETHVKATQLIEEANTKAFDIGVAAQAQANELIADAKTKAEAEKNALADDVLILTNTKTTLKAECDALGDKVKDMNTEAEAAEKRLNKIRADIAKLAVA